MIRNRRTEISIETWTTPAKERVSRVTRPDGSQFVVVVPRGGLGDLAPPYWRRPWITEGSAFPTPIGRSGWLNLPRPVILKEVP